MAYCRERRHSLFGNFNTIVANEFHMYCRKIKARQPNERDARCALFKIAFLERDLPGIAQQHFLS
jgi:hypothetical protein